MSRKSPPNDLKLHSTRISERILKDLKIKAINEDLTVQDIVNMALASLLYKGKELADRLEMACVDYEDYEKLVNFRHLVDVETVEPPEVE